MKYFFLFLINQSITLLHGQVIDSLNTAKNCIYMTKAEKEMIYEINRVRSNPTSFLVYLEPMLEEARQDLIDYGKGERNYSISYSSDYGTDKNNIDTIWHYVNEEEVKALSTLIDDLKKLKALSVLKPDAGIYKAASKHATDQRNHKWQLGHTGTDGSHPWDRIYKFSPAMDFGNENIAGNSADVTPRDIVIQLLIDSGIPGYGHRYNMLDPSWTHVACKGEKFGSWKNWWIQNFGRKKKR